VSKYQCRKFYRQHGVAGHSFPFEALRAFHNWDSVFGAMRAFHNWDSVFGALRAFHNWDIVFGVLRAFHNRDSVFPFGHKGLISTLPF